jgi:hypothetical protein
MDPELTASKLQMQPPTSSQALDVTAHTWTRKHARKNARIDAKAKVRKSVIIMSDKMPDGISEYMSYRTPEKLPEKRILEYMADRVLEWMLYTGSEYMLDRIVEWSLMGVTREKYIEMEREKKFIRKK